MSILGNCALQYDDYVNYLVNGVFPKNLGYHQRKQFLFDVKKCFQDETFLLYECADGMIQHFFMKVKMKDILEACHSFPFDGHHGEFRISAKAL